MNQFFEWISKGVSSLRCWIVIPPWEAAIRVRLGKNAKALQPGLHLRLPFIDVIMLVNTRLRVTTAPPTSTTHDNRTRVTRVTVGYCVHDPLRAIKCFTHPDVVVKAQAQALAKGTEEECLRGLREAFDNTGVRIEFARYVDDVHVPGLRIIQNQWEQVEDRCEPTSDDRRY